jgi:hypothetical protein
MIPLCSRFDSVLFTPKMSAIASYGNYSRSPNGLPGGGRSGLLTIPHIRAIRNEAALIDRDVPHV